MATQKSISPKYYPKERAENVQWRAYLISRAQGEEEENLAIQAALKKYCADNILFWFNLFLWLYEPRPDKIELHGSDSAILPFITYDYQDEFILDVQEHIAKGEDLLAKKSRDMGVSWIVLAVFLHFWQFGGPGNDFHLGSRTQDYVDKLGEMSSLMPKIRFLINRQPEWLYPLGFDPSRNMGFLNIQNPETESVITGEANNEYFGSGGRKKAILFDEFAKWKKTDQAAWQACADNTDCRIPVSSANGKQNHFYRLQAGLEGKIDVKTLHWTKHPHKDQAWYEAECRRRPPQEVAAEIDIDFSASVSNKAYESFDFNRHVQPVRYNPKLPITLMCDFNIDPMCWALAFEHGPWCRFFDELVMHTTSTASAAEEFCKRFRNHEYRHVEIYGDATGSNRQRSVKGLYSDYDVIANVLQRNEWKYVLNTKRRNPLVPESIVALNKRLDDWEHPLTDEEGNVLKDENGELIGFHHWIEIDPGCKTLIESLEQTQRKDDGIDKSDNIEHMTDGPRYWAEYKYPTSRAGMEIMGR